MLGHLAHDPAAEIGTPPPARVRMKSADGVRTRIAAHVGEENGRAREVVLVCERVYFDSATILRQLGLIPALTVAW